VDVAHGGGRGLGAGGRARVVTMLVRPDGTALRELARLVADARLRVAVDRSFELGDAAAAHAYGEKRATAGKLTLEIA